LLKSGVLGLTIINLLSCADLNNSYPSSGGYRDPYYGRQTYRDNDYYRDKRIRREERELERERDRLEDERRELERERSRSERRERRSHSSGEHASPPREVGCPSGFYPSDKKCTKDERKHGCKDLRNSAGQLCVHR